MTSCSTARWTVGSKRFKAIDANEGTLLWKFKTDSGISSQPITYRGPDGKQYVAVLDGIGGWAGAAVVGNLDTRDQSAANGFAYVWAPQRRGFIRTALNAGLCDVVMGVPRALGNLETSRPYYRSSCVFVLGPRAPRVSSLDAAELRQLRIGVTLVGAEGANPPPLFALALRGLVANIRGYSVYGDYRNESPPAELIRALRRNETDLAIAWGLLAGYYASQGRPRLSVAPLRQAEAPPGLDFAFDISLGVRKGDARLLADLNRALTRQHAAIATVLARYSVPISSR